MNKRDIFLAVFFSALIVVGLDLMTNAIDTQKYAWDFRYYIAMAKDGFNAQPMASPFAYRYLTPFLVHGLSLLGLSVENGFLVTAYVGAIAQLTGIILFVHWMTKSLKGAYLAMLVTALSLFNVKFLLFDIYRPDHLAYALILLSTYFAFERKFLPLLLTTIIASQIREFAIVPLFAYLFSFARLENRRAFSTQTSISALFLMPAILLPRLLIPVSENYQIVGLSKEGLITALALPFIPTIDINFVFSILAYVMPLLLLADIKSIRSAFASLPNERRSYLGIYIILVLILSFLGGTDFFRFTTFLFLPQVLLIGMLVQQASNLQIVFMLLATFIFNRIWLPFPIWDKERYLDFYSGFALRLNWNTLFRFLENLAFVAVGFIFRKRINTPQS